MAEKSTTETNEKNQSQSFDQEINELREALSSDIEEMEKMEFADFRREILDHFKTMGEAVFILFDELTEEKKRMDGCLDIIIQDNKDLRKKIDGMAQTLFMLVCKAKGPPISKKDREAIWEMMGYRWTHRNEQTLKDACMQSIL